MPFAPQDLERLIAGDYKPEHYSVGGVQIHAETRIDDLPRSIRVAPGLEAGLYLARIGDSTITPAFVVRTTLGQRATHIDQGLQRRNLTAISDVLKAADGVNVYESDLPPWRLTATHETDDMVAVLDMLPQGYPRAIAYLKQAFSSYTIGAVRPKKLDIPATKIAPSNQEME